MSNGVQIQIDGGRTSQHLGAGGRGEMGETHGAEAWSPRTDGVRGCAVMLGRDLMLWTIAVILLILWVLGFFAFHLAGGLIHILLVIAVIVVLVKLFTGRGV